MAGTARSPRVPAVQRAAILLDAVAAAPAPIALAALARQTALPKSSVSGICAALTAEGLLLRGQDGSYRLGPRLAQLAGTARQGRPLFARVGVALPSTEDRFFAAELEAISQEADALQAALLHRSADRRLGVQREQIMELLERGIDLLLVDPVATEGLESSFAAAREAGVPVVSLNGASAGADAAVTTDNTQAGFLAGRFLADRLGSAGSVVILDGTKVTAVTDRIAGFLEALREQAGVHITARLPGDNTSDTAEALMRELLENGTVPDAVFAINDPSAIGVASACTEHGIAPAIVGVDGSEAALRQIRQGGPVIGTVAQDPHRLGRSALRLGVELRAGVQPAQRTVLLPTRLIAAAQANDYRSWG